MIPSLTRPVPAWSGLLRAGVAVLVAVAAGLGLVELLLRPPMDDLQALGLYMLVSAAATVGVGAFVVVAMDRAGVTTLRTRIALGSVIGALVGLLNVLIVSQLMFVSTAHDLRLLAALVGFSSLVALGFSGWVASRVSGQLQVVRWRIRGLAAGDYATRIAPTGADEISMQARDLNELARLLQAAEASRDALDRERRDLTVAISHDLRTPLASIRAMAEALVDGVVSEPGEVGRYHSTIRKEVERLGRMVDDLFQIAQIDSGALALDRHPISLHEVAAEVTDGMQARAAAAGIALTLGSSEVLPPIALDGALMERAIGNLVANAIEHTPAGGTVTVTARRMGRAHRLSVADTGDGIDAADQERVWQPFFRADRSRNRVPGLADGVRRGDDAVEVVERDEPSGAAAHH
ncbi:MAG: HAMP domain-containing sensor histidine kinase, partial [Chloroflexota bacterium]